MIAVLAQAATDAAETASNSLPDIAVPHIDWTAIGPSTVLVVGALLLLLVTALFKPRPFRGFYAAYTVVVAGVAALFCVPLWDRVRELRGAPALAGAVQVDGFGVFLTLTICAAVALAALINDDFLRREGLEGPETYVLTLLSASGGVILATANDLIVVFLGLEVLSIALYVLAGSHLRRAESQEAAVKYFVLGALSSAILLYGIALVYGATGSTNLAEISQSLSANVAVEHNGLLLGGAAMLLVGLGFKVAAVPFHMWAPDVYQGAPTPAVGFMAAAAKVAGFAGLLRIFDVALQTQRLDWQPLVWTLAVLSMVVGSVLAVVQNDIKRMLGYSSVSHAGYIMIGLQTGSDKGISGALFYLLVYTFIVAGSFAVVTVVGRRGDADHGLDAYRGLARRRPVLAAAFTLFLLAQAGVPLTSGFVAKFGVIQAAVEAHSYAIAIIAMLAAVVAAFFYLRVMVLMYASDDPASNSDAGPATASPLRIPLGLGIALGAAVAITLFAGWLPQFFVDFAQRATLS